MSEPRFDYNNRKMTMEQIEKIRAYVRDYNKKHYRTRNRYVEALGECPVCGKHHAYLYQLDITDKRDSQVVRRYFHIIHLGKSFGKNVYEGHCMPDQNIRSFIK